MATKRERQRKYKILARTLPEGVLITDKQGTLTYVNPALEEMFGIPSTVSVGTDFRRYIAAESVRIAEEAFLGCAQGKTMREVELRAVHGDRHVFSIEIVASPIFKAGEFQGVESVVRDITARKRAEEALRQSEHRYRKLFEASLAGVYLTKPDGTILDFNEAMRRMLGYDTREEVFQHRSTDFYADPEFRKELIYLLQRDGIVPAMEAVLRRKDGSVLYALGHAVLLRNEQTGEPYIQGVAIDITERKQAEEALRELTRTLESKVANRTAELQQRTRQLEKMTLELSEAEDRERRRLAAILHDDLQQQLAAARFQVQRVRNQARHDVSLQATAAQADHLLKDAIAKSRSLSHELSPTVMRHDDFAETLRWLANEVQTKHGLAVHMKADSEVRCESEAIRSLLFRAAQELLFNVVKHAQVREAHIRVRQGTRCICLSVTDYGRGFDPQALGETAGFGLLSIRERVESLKGRMKIKSAPRQGSTFFIAIPTGPEIAEAAGESPRASPASAPPGGPEGPPLRVLLVDDHEITREGLLALLREEHSIEVVGEAANGREAVALAEELEPGVVVMDVSMPLMGGDEATRRIKAQRPQTRVVALSMYEEPAMMEQMRRAGAESYVAKTAPTEELLAAIQGRKTEEAAVDGR